MALLGPDGKPLSRGMVIGGPKSLADLPLIPSGALAEMAAQADDLMGQGTPLEVPVAMPQAILFGMLRTLQQGEADRKMLQQALGMLQLAIQSNMSGPDNKWADIINFTSALGKHLNAPERTEAS